MNALEEAREWYQATQRQLWLMQRLAGKFWDQLPWAEGLATDNGFRELTGPGVVRAETERGLEHLDDLAVVVLFSVFEARVRDSVLSQLLALSTAPAHPAVRKALDDAEQWVKEGSFYRILDTYKVQVNKNLIEQVNQVRKYRNWVAHGRRATDQPDNVTPQAAYDRLRAFLSALGLA